MGGTGVSVGSGVWVGVGVGVSVGVGVGVSVGVGVYVGVEVGVWVGVRLGLKNNPAGNSAEALRASTTHWLLNATVIEKAITRKSAAASQTRAGWRCAVPSAHTRRGRVCSCRRSTGWVSPRAGRGKSRPRWKGAFSPHCAALRRKRCAAQCIPRRARSLEGLI
ncbi:MAG TPA: hypothetical protein DEQ80_11625 [Anaerolinea thermolimosa]|uniref:Uncharacterized protein n=1 Tax=Anaerolinea thermolimosa TaxID=229919 RepID=A0A3D1JIV0_9CHLR|nr:hypothetical protein [Anaerolinea thermolimosa]